MMLLQFQTIMKQVLLILSLALLASAVPKLETLEFRHLPKAEKGFSHKPNTRIIGGAEAIPHSIPYQVFLTCYHSYDPGNGASCGGSIISANYVLTAAHCCSGFNEALIKLGAHNLDEDEDTTVTLISKEININPNYSKGIIFDCATIKLPTTITFTNAIQPITLPRRSDASNRYQDVYARVSGWGSDTATGPMTNVLKYADVKIIRNRLCEAYLYTTIHPNFICASPEEGSVACFGDSGGPLVVDGVQIAMVTFGTEYCVHYPSGYLLLTPVLDWIEAHSDVVIKN